MSEATKSLAVQKVREQIELMKGTISQPETLPFKIADANLAEMQFIFEVPVIENTQTPRTEYVAVKSTAAPGSIEYDAPETWLVYQVEPKFRQVRTWEKKK